MKKSIMLLCVFVLLMFNVSALGDQAVYVEPSVGDIQKEEAITLAAAQLANAFGFTSAFFLSSPTVETAFYIDHDSEPSQQEPVWLVSFSSPENYAGAYTVKLSRHGEVIMYQAAGSIPYYAGDADLLTASKPAIPTAYDTPADTVIQYAKESVSEISDYSRKQIQSLDAEADFVYNNRFCEGLEPVWLVYLYDKDALVFKALYGYDGSYMEIIPAGQDFTAILRPGFYAAGDLKQRMNIVDLWEMSVEEKSDFVKKWKPIYDEYAASHPYFTRQKDMIYLATRHAYGVPDEEDITQDEATDLGKAAIVALGASAETLHEAYIEYVFDVADAANPQWKLFFSITGSIYHVEINAKSGEVTRALEVLPEMDIASFRY